MIRQGQSQNVEEIIKKHIEAIGGYEKIKAISTITFEGTNKSATLETSFKSYIIQDSAACTIGIANGKESKGTVTKKDGWICHPGSAKGAIKKTRYEIKQEQRSLDIHGPLIDYEKKGNTIKYWGIEKINDTAYYKLRVKRSDKNTLIYYIDSITYMVKRVVWLWPVGNQPEFTYDYTYKTFDNGYTFVIKLIRAEGNLVTTYSNYVINPEIDRSIFTPCK
jgi:hypothetical protein